MKKFPWFRLYANDMLGDRKLKRIHKMTGLSLAELRGVWLSLMCLASESPQRGILLFDGGTPYEYDDLAEECGLETLKFHTAFIHFSNMGMITFDEITGIYKLPNWDKRQPVSDTTGAERVKAYRERKNKPVTLQKRYSNALEGEGDKESEGEEEVNDFRALFDAFILETGIPETMLANKNNVDTVVKWQKSGVTVEDIKLAVSELSSKGYTIARPQSIDNALIIAMQKRDGRTPARPTRTMMIENPITGVAEEVEVF